MSNFSYPRRTKSGRSFIDLWSAIKEVKQQYKKAVLDDNDLLMKHTAGRLKELIDDLGIKGYEPLIIDFRKC